MGDVKPQPEQSLDDYLAWLEDTPPDQLPSGEDVSDLGMLGRTLYEHVSQDEVTRRVAVALQRGRSWHEISYYLGKTETAVRAEYGPATGKLASPHKVTTAMTSGENTPPSNTTLCQYQFTRNGRKSQPSNSSDCKCYQSAALVNERQPLEFS